MIKDRTEYLLRNAIAAVNNIARGIPYRVTNPYDGHVHNEMGLCGILRDIDPVFSDAVINQLKDLATTLYKNFGNLFWFSPMWPDDNPDSKYIREKIQPRLHILYLQLEKYFVWKHRNEGIYHGPDRMRIYEFMASNGYINHFKVCEMNVLELYQQIKDKDCHLSKNHRDIIVNTVKKYYHDSVQ